MTNRTYNDLVSEVTEWLENALKPGMDAHRYAVATIEECTPRYDSTILFEVSGMHSASGNPVTASFDGYDDEDGYGWWAFTGANLPTSYGFGTREEASAYQDRLNAGREINHYEVHYLPWADARAMGIDDRTDAVNLEEALAAS
jgi:hypothetical protein